MMNLLEKVAVYQLGLETGYFKLPKVIDWVDTTILQLDASEIPYELYEVSLSSNKTIEDVISLLREITRGNYMETASKVVLSLLCKSMEKKEMEIDQIVTVMYRLAWQHTIKDDDLFDDLFLEINRLEAEYEMAVDGYGNLQSVRKEIQEFLRKYNMHGEFL